MLSTELTLKLGEWLNHQGLPFTKIEGVSTDYVTGSLDIWYLDGRDFRRVDEIDDPTDLLEFLVKRG